MSKTNNTVEKAIVDADKVAKALMEGSHKQLRSIMEESIAKLIKEEEEDDKTENPTEDASKETEENSYEVEDVNTEDDKSEENSTEGENDSKEEEDGEKTEDNGDTEDEWSELSDFKIGDEGEDYDFTGADGETILKAYSKLGDNDEIVVTKDEDGNIELKDGEAGTEYVIELNPEGMDDDNNDATDEFDFNLDNEDPEDGELDIDIEGDNEENNEDEITLDLNEENLGYTTDYQKPVFSTSMMSGERNYGKKGNGEPFEGNIDECGNKGCGTSECGNMEESMTLRKSYKTKRINKAPIAHEDYVDAGSQINTTAVNENKKLKEQMKKLYESAKQIQAENKQYKENNTKLNEAIESIKKSLYEAAVVNKNLGRIVNLLVNETTTREEKNEILDSFNNVKTLKEGERLYESYRQKFGAKTQKTAIMERTISMSNPSLNETTIYTQKNPSLDLMNRIDNLYKH